MTTLLLCTTLLLAGTPATQPLPELVDDMVFHEALRSRGLNDWLELQLTDRAPADQIGTQLRNREKLLGQAANAATRPSDDSPNTGLISQASQILVELIEKHPAHPGSFRWRFELARDLLERQNPAAFEKLLIYELPGQDFDAVAQLSRQARKVLTALRSRIEQSWEAVEALDEQSLADLRASGRLSVMEELDARSAALLIWAQLHEALTAQGDRDRQRAAFADVLDGLEKSGRLDLPRGRELEQASALLMAAVAERHLGKHDQADGHARQVISLWGRMDKSLRQRLRQTVLIAVLEQIRALRDAGRHEAALQSLEQARQWAANVRSDDPAALVAVSLLEVTVLYARQAQASPAQSTEAGADAALPWLDCEPCLAVLERTSRDSVTHRDLLYSTLAPALESVPPAQARHAVAVQLLAGAVVSRNHVAANTERLQSLIAQLHQTLASQQLNPATQGELRYLLGQLLERSGAGLDAIHALNDLAEQMPEHDRSFAALRWAVTLAGAELRRAGSSGSPASRAAFVRAARLLRERAPEASNVAGLTYSIASALEHEGRHEQAAMEYAAVPADAALWQDAALGALRCWRRALESASRSDSDAAERSPEIARLAEKATDAVRTVSEGYAGQNETLEDCGQARLLLASAELLNHPAIAGAEQVAQLMADASRRFSPCPESIGPALRQRIIALKQLKQLAEAREVVDRYLLADAGNAGTTMAGLLQSMHQEIEDCLQRGDGAAAKTIAAEAVQLGGSLLAWADQHTGRLQDQDILVTRLWHAWALLHADRPADALVAFERIESQAKSSLPTDSGVLLRLQLGRADALLELNRPAEAAGIYSEVWQKSPEHSEPWWHALTGSLQCSVVLETSPREILQSITQHRFLAPDLGGGRWQLQITALEEKLQAGIATRAAP